MMKIIGLDLLFSESVMTWDDVRVPMKDFSTIKKSTEKEANVLYTDLDESQAVQNMSRRTTRILDAQYQRANLAEYLEEECAELTDQ